MPFTLRSVDDLIEELGTEGQANKLLKLYNIPVSGGYFDEGALEAIRKEPKESNIGRSTTNRWTISETDGIGALKKLFDTVQLDISRHVLRNGQFVTVRNSKGIRREVKVYTRQRIGSRSNAAHFQISGFLAGDAARYYLCCAYEGPIAWVFPLTVLKRLHSAALKEAAKPGAMVTLPGKDEQTHEGGVIRLRLKSGDEQYLFRNAKQLEL